MVTMCLSAGVLLKAGANYSNDLNAGTQGMTGKDIIEEWIEEAEMRINAITRYDWVTNWASIDAEFIDILQETCSAMAAMRAISYDMKGYSQLSEAQTMLDVLKDTIDQNIEILRDETITEKFI